MANSTSVILDNTGKVFKALGALTGKAVYVGVPSKNASREESPVNNAAIAYVMEFGSPATNVPPRPFLLPGVRKSRDMSLRQLRQAADAALKGDESGVMSGLGRAGIAALTEVQRMIQSNIPPPLKPSTIANRFRQRRGVRGVKSRRESEQVYLDLVRKGVAPGVAQSETNITALINTGSMLRSITYVVVDESE